MKNVYVVLGMARSGTSAITRGFKVLGIELGEHLIGRTDDWNPKGVFEDSDIVYKINRNASFMIDYGWLQSDYATKYPALQPLQAQAVKLLSERVASLPNYGFKDPRMVKLLPFWHAVFKEANVNDQYVIVLRNPLAVAHSNLTFSKIDLEVSLIEWLQTMITMIDATQGRQRLIVSYENMLADPRKELVRMHQGLTSLSIHENEMTAYINEFLDQKLKHHRFSESDLTTQAAAQITPLLSQTYALLLRVAQDELTLESTAFQQAWLSIKTGYAELTPIFQYIDVLHKRNKQLSRDIRTIQQSLPWKLSYPFRLVDDTLRARRQQKRAQRKTTQATG